MRKWQRYTQEFKDQAVERLKGCTNVEALARELNVSRGILYLWRDKHEGRPPASKRPGPVVDTPAIAALKKEVVQLKVALADQSAGSGFFQRSLAKSRGSSPQAAEALAIRHLRLHRRSDAIFARQAECGTDVHVGTGQPGWILSMASKRAAWGRRDCGPCSHSGNRRRASSSLRIPAHHGRTSSSRDGGEPQACSANDARRQSAGDSKAEVRLHDRFTTSI